MPSDGRHRDVIAGGGRNRRCRTITPGLYPDPLQPLDPEEGLTALPGQWRSVWLTVRLHDRVRPGLHDIVIRFEDSNGGPVAEERLALEVISANLPKQRLLHTEWFHADCLEFSHLFTQWGAKHAPKIVAWEEGESRRIFGWETDASGEEYAHFLDRFLPELDACIQNRGLAGKCYFHVSDEPGIDSLESYRSASRIIRKHLSRYPVIDALSDFAFYEQGLVKRPIPASNHIGEFLSNGVPDLWTYYCCSQYRGTVLLLEKGLEHPITFTEFPAEAEWIGKTRERINRAIAGS